ncbi:MAG: hypothetical protein ACXVEE_24390 [Polyangiales bacterium]
MNRAPIALLVMCIFLGACAGVLGLKRRDLGRPFEHRAHLVKGVNCLKCHAGVARAGDEGPLHLPTTATCTSCHTKPHDTRECATCHGEEHKRVAAAGARTYLKFAHQQHLPGLKGQCVPCHAGAGGDATTLRPPMAQCFTCHAHKDQWATRTCEACHHDLPAEQVKPASHVVHDGDFLREHGIRAAASADLCATCHSDSACSKCHGKNAPVLPWRLATEKPTLSTLHPANFLARHPFEAKAQTGLCSTCHAENFCLDCHVKKKVAAQVGVANPHPPGWVRAKGGEHGHAARLDPIGCASCHGGSGEALCVGCHRVGGPGGSPHGPGFSSKRDKVKDEPCRMCHAS